MTHIDGMTKRQLRKHNAEKKRNIYKLTILEFMEQFVKQHGNQQGLSNASNRFLNSLLKSKPEDAHLIRQAASGLNKELLKAV